MCLHLPSLDTYYIHAPRATYTSHIAKQHHQRFPTSCTSTDTSNKLPTSIHVYMSIFVWYTYCMFVYIYQRQIHTPTPSVYVHIYQHQIHTPTQSVYVCLHLPTPDTHTPSLCVCLNQHQIHTPTQSVYVCLNLPTSDTHTNPVSVCLLKSTNIRCAKINMYFIDYHRFQTYQLKHIPLHVQITNSLNAHQPSTPM